MSKNIKKCLDKYFKKVYNDNVRGTIKPKNKENKDKNYK